MIATLSFGLRDQRDRSILLIDYAGDPWRSEIVSLDISRDDTDEGKGRIAIEDRGLILTFRGKTGWREVEISRVQRVTRDDHSATGDRLSDKHNVWLIREDSQIRWHSS